MPATLTDTKLVLKDPSFRYPSKIRKLSPVKPITLRDSVHLPVSPDPSANLRLFRKSRKLLQALPRAPQPNPFAVFSLPSVPRVCMDPPGFWLSCRQEPRPITPSVPAAYGLSSLCYYDVCPPPQPLHPGPLLMFA